MVRNLFRVLAFRRLEVVWSSLGIIVRSTTRLVGTRRGRAVFDHSGGLKITPFTGKASIGSLLSRARRR